MQFKFLLFSGLFSSVFCAAQDYPRQYFRHPLNIPMELVANFGEIRTNHWHMGLDIRTQRRVNLPVFAAAEGYISRVSVEPGGFGQAIYITHPNGFTTLYAHLNAFYPALANYVKQQQYARESWRVNLDLPSEMFQVKKGDQIGLSGSTGASEGPHVHFEIRDNKTGNCLNPLLFRFPIADAIPPTISRLAMYNRNKSTYAQQPQFLALRKSGAFYIPGSGLVKVGSNRISFAIGATDRFSATPNPNGIFSATMLVDNIPVSGFEHDNISYNDTRYINAQLDPPHKTRGGGSLQHISPLPGARDVAYSFSNGDGILQLSDTLTHEILIEVKDANGNTSKIRFKLKYDPALESLLPPYTGPLFKPGEVNIFEEDRFELFTSEQSIYDTVGISFSATVMAGQGAISPLFRFLGPHIPVHDTITVRIKPDQLSDPDAHHRVVIKNTSGTRTYLQRAVRQNGWYAAKFRQFGTYQAFVDTIPPTVNAPATNLSRATRIVFTPRDNFNTIRSFRAELNGQWLRCTNDKGRSWIYSFDEKFPRGTHELKVIVEDEAGNVMERAWNVVR